VGTASDREREQPGPLSERPVDELRAVQEALQSDRQESTDRCSVRLADATVTLFEQGDLARTSARGTTARLTRSELWRADLDVVQAAIRRRL